MESGNMSDIIIEVIGDITMLLIVTALMLYISYRDDKRQDMTEIRYDRLIGKIMDDVANQQMYKQELITDIKELSIIISKISGNVERIVNDMNDMTNDVKNISSDTKHIKPSLQIIADKIDSEFSATNLKK